VTWNCVETRRLVVNIRFKTEIQLMPPFSTLIVEDYADFRRILRTLLEEKTQCFVVGEALDGVQAVKMAEELQPELILLDLSLPSLNGMEAARQIHSVSPSSKLIFLSQNTSPEVMQGAFCVGAMAYLLKSDAGELPFAIEAVLKGEQFVSSRLHRHSKTVAG
jgi:DNA-binding NarL/FixJ family response regulator